MISSIHGYVISTSRPSHYQRTNSLTTVAQLLQLDHSACVTNFDFAAGTPHQEGRTVVYKQDREGYIYGGVSEKSADVCLVASSIKIETIMQVGHRDQLFIGGNR